MIESASINRHPTKIDCYYHLMTISTGASNVPLVPAIFPPEAIRFGSCWNGLAIYMRKHTAQPFVPFKEHSSAIVYTYLATTEEPVTVISNWEITERIISNWKYCAPVLPENNGPAGR